MIADLGAVEQSSNGVSAPAVPAAGQGHFETRQSALAALGRKALAAPDVLLLMQDAASLLADTLNAPFCLRERTRAEGANAFGTGSFSLATVPRVR